MAEWSIAAVLKTVELKGSGGSNPSLSAESLRQKATAARQILQYQKFVDFLFYFCLREKPFKSQKKTHFWD